MAGVSRNDESDSQRLPEIPLDTTSAERKAFLLKITPELARSWEEQRVAGSTESVGRMNVTLNLLDPQAPPKYTLEVPGKDGESRTKYELNSMNDFGAMCAFSEAPHRKLAAEGTVTSKLHMQSWNGVSDLDKYGKVFQERARKASVRRTLQVMEDDYGIHMVPQPGATSTGGEDNKSCPAAKGKGERRVRGDFTNVENEVFKLFEANPNWELTSLITKSDQPVKFLKAILSDLCIFNKNGPNQGTYELKPEYKPNSRSAEDAPAAPTG